MVDIVQIKSSNQPIYPKTHVKAIESLVSYESPVINLGGGLQFTIKNFLSTYTINFYGVVNSIAAGRTIFSKVINSDYRPNSNKLIQTVFLIGDSVSTDYKVSILLLTTGDIHVISSGITSNIEMGFNYTWIG